MNVVSIHITCLCKSLHLYLYTLIHLKACVFCGQMAVAVHICFYMLRDTFTVKFFGAVHVSFKTEGATIGQDQI